MGQRAQKWINRTGRTALWLMAFAFILLILTQVTLWAGILWLSSKDGQGWLKTRLQETSTASGYAVTIEGLHYRLLTGIEADTIKIADSSGPLLDIQNAQAHLEIYPLSTRTLLLSVIIDKATIHRLPQSKENNAPKAILEPFALPDIYFRNLSLSKLAIKTLTLKEGITPQSVTLSPTLRGRITRQNQTLTGKLFLDIGKIETQQDLLKALIPHKSDFHAMLDLNRQNLDIKKTQLLAPAYALNAKGDVKLDATKTIALDLSLRSNTLDQINPALTGRLNAALAIEGPFDQMNALAKAELALENFKEKGFSALNIDILAQNLTKEPEGKIEITATQGEAPVKLSANFAGKKESFFLNDIKGAAPDLSFTGKASASQGNLDAYFHKARLKDLHLKHTSLKITPSLENKGQSITLNGTGQQDKPFDFDLSINRDERNNTVTGRIKAGKGLITLNGKADAQNIDLRAATKAFPLRDFPLTLPEPWPALTLSGNAQLSGLPQSPEIKTDISLHTDNIRLTGQGLYQKGKARLSLKGTGRGIKTLDANAALPLTFSLAPFALDINGQTPLEGKFSGHFEAQSLAGSLLPPVHAIEGTIKTNGMLSGTLKTPNINAELSAQNAHYTHKPLGIMLDKINLFATIEQNKLTLKSLSAQDGKQGRLSASGTVNLNAPHYDADIKLSGKDLHLLQGKNLNGILSTTLTFKGQRPNYKLSGTITTQQLDVTLPEHFGQSIPALNIVTPQEAKGKGKEQMQNITLDVSANAPQKVFVRGWGLDAEFGGKLKITGTAASPLYDGKFDILRGRYSEFGKRFEITKANMLFAGPIPPNPSLDITAETQAEDITARVNITGTPSAPSISFSAVPTLPEDEVLSRILFGRDMSKISPFQAVQLTQTLQRFSGQGGSASFDPLGLLRTSTGLDDLRVETDENGGASVGAGKYLSDNVYLELEGGSAENSGEATIEIELTPNITLESEIGQDAQGGAGVFWKWDY